jgi:uncharacterized membrane protein
MREMSTRPEPDSLDPDVSAAGAATPPVRLQALADGVFAIAMTLLVLELAVPAMVAGELADALLEMWPEFLMYTLSFLVLGVYWLIHHMVFDSIRRYDSALVWLNIAYLMFAALIPFSTALIVEYGATTTTAVVYGLNMLLLFLVGWAMWSYATAGHRLVAADVDDALIAGGRRMGLAYLAVLVAASALAFVSPVVSMVVYAMIVVAFVGFTVAGRWETVTIWRRSASR